MPKQLVQTVRSIAIQVLNFRRIHRFKSLLKHSYFPSDSQSSMKSRILVFQMRAWTFHALFEILLAIWLRARGQMVTVVTCGGGRSYCDYKHKRKISKFECRSCNLYSKALARAAGFKVSDNSLRSLASFRTAPENNDIHCHVDEVDSITSTSVRWVVRNSVLNDETKDVAIRASVEGEFVRNEVRNCFQEIEPDQVFLLNGRFFFERIASDVAQEKSFGGKDINVVTHERGYRKNHVFLSKTSPACDYDMSESWAVFQDIKLSDEENLKLDEMISKRVIGEDVHSNFWSSPVFDWEASNYDVALTNVPWDTAVLARKSIFTSQEQWLKDLISLYERTGNNLVIRIHPAEERYLGDSQSESVTSFLASLSLPQNVTAIPASSQISTYSIMGKAGFVLPFATTAGLEACLSGKIVIPAADAVYSRKGFTVDCVTKEEYLDVLAHREMDRLTTDVEKARRFAFHFFFRMQTDLSNFLHEDEQLGTLVQNPFFPLNGIADNTFTEIFDLLEMEK